LQGIYDLLDDEYLGMMQSVVVGFLKIKRYVVNFLIICEKRILEMKNVLEEFNNIYCTLSFTLEEENENSLNFLDISVNSMENPH